MRGSPGSASTGTRGSAAPRRASARAVDPAAALIAVLGAATVAAVWTLQARGYTPCELCLKERVPFYIGTPLAAALAVLAPRLPRAAVRTGFGVLVLLFAAGAALGVYHAGVEAKLWAGPTGCSGAAAAPAAVSDFLAQLKTVTVVRCDEAALQVLGLSLAAWNALLSALLAAVAAAGLRGSA
ncbi:disulfide bond formation protein B [Lichenibacterium dinghuense]|uniref:disulfide bond formation protein B n=1 Tax=Lichenibacterium dinghuense TaxID=2895977 RepID=UPI001F483A1F|nr:disulfide bond formation protein B [Lichenibacterium sp. 6Y81]